MRQFILEQGKKVGIWYGSFVFIEFMIPVVFLNVNMPIMQNLIQSVQNNSSDEFMRTLIYFACAQMAYEFIWRTRDWTKINCSILLRKNTMSELAKKTLRINPEFFQSQTGISITNSIRNISESTERVFMIVSKIFRYMSYMLFVPIKVFSISYQASIAFIVWIVLWISGSILLFNNISKDSIRLSEIKNRLLSNIGDIMNNIDNVFVYNTYEQEDKNISTGVNKVAKCDRKVQIAFLMLWITQGVFFTFFTFVIIYLLFKSGKLDPSVFVFLYKVITDLIEFMWSSSEYIFDFVENYGRIKNGLSLLQNEHTSPYTLPKFAVEDKGKIIFKGVRFQGNNSNVACEFDAEIEKDKFVALIGQSGSGKSTFAKLILRILQPQEGEVINTITGDSFAYAQQNFNIFSNTVKYNVLYGIHREVSDEELESVLRKAACDFVFKLPHAYNTHIEDGNLSQGELQRLSVARAILADAEVTVFDEPTSALDLKTEYEVMQAICENKKTKIVIAHKIQTVKNADLVIVFDSGKIVAQGAPHELSNNEYYSALI